MNVLGSILIIVIWDRKINKIDNGWIGESFKWIVGVFKKGLYLCVFFYSIVG